MFVSRVVQQQG